MSKLWLISSLVLTLGVARVSAGVLFPRQSSLPAPTAIPAACQSTCAPFLAASNACTTDPSCLCTPGNGRSLETCINCLVGLSPDENAQAQGRAILDAFVMNCNGAVPSLSLTGSNSPSTSAPSSSTSSSTSLFPGQSFPPVSGSAGSAPGAPTNTPGTVSNGAAPSRTAPQQTITDASGGGTDTSGGGSAQATNPPNSAQRVIVGVLGVLSFAVVTSGLLF